MMRALITKTLFVLSILLSTQALAFDAGGLSYTAIGVSNNVEVNGRASGNTDTDILMFNPILVGVGGIFEATSIGDGAFANNSLTSVRIAPLVTTIGSDAFFDNALTSVDIPDWVTTIRARAFSQNILSSVTIGNRVTTIGNQAFAVNALASVVIPESVTSIGDGAFANNPLTSVAFEGNFGDFQLDMLNANPTLTTISYCEGTTGHSI
jgi:hypothetical protein